MVMIIPETHKALRQMLRDAIDGTDNATKEQKERLDSFKSHTKICKL